jgi:hypothetical protein
MGGGGMTSPTGFNQQKTGASSSEQSVAVLFPNPSRHREVPYLFLDRKRFCRRLLGSSNSGLPPGDETTSLLPAVAPSASCTLGLEIMAEANFFNAITAPALLGVRHL